MKRKLSVLGLLVLIISLLATSAGAQSGSVQFLGTHDYSGATSTDMVDETPAFWFVELSGSPGAAGGNAANVRKEHASFRAAANAKGLKFRERLAFDTLWNGVSIEASRTTVSQIAKLPGVKAVYPVEVLSLPERENGPSPQMVTALAMTGADIAQSELGLTGAGIKVAIMDSGIDYLHPDLGGGFGPGYRVTTGWDFVGDDFNADPTSPTYNPVPVPDPDPMDCDGHGTHVAGIVGANGRIKGVAPDVTFGAYRVFGCDGSTTSDIMLAAMEMALRDGMDILNMSIGSAFQWPQYPTAVAADRLVQRGMVVVASIGNSGETGAFSASAPGVGQDVIGVAAYDNTHSNLPVFTISDDDTEIGYTSATASPVPPTDGSLDVALPGMTLEALEFCSEWGGDDSLAGKAVLIARGTCPFHDKARNAQAAGAAAVILFNNVAGRVNPTVEGDVPITIPVAAITLDDGLLIMDRALAGGVTMTWTDRFGMFESPTGGLISAFSSYGLAPDLSLKPDIGAPGGQILSTYPRALGEYATISGTSMASPHVAGAAALYLQAHPKAKPADVRTALQTTAEPQLWWGNPGLGFLDSVHRQGAGMVQVDRAITASTVVTPSKISLGEGEAGPVRTHVRLKNNSKQKITYDLSYEDAITTLGTYAVNFYLVPSIVTFDSDSVTLNGNAAKQVKVTISHPDGVPDGMQYGGYIVLTPRDGGQVYRIPYAGITGDYQAIEVMTPTVYGFPWLVTLEDGTYYREEDGVVYTMEGDNVPFVLLHLDHQSSLLRLEVLDAKGKTVGTAYEIEHLPRNSTATGFFAFDWDGQVMQGAKKFRDLPNGEYRLRVSVLKALGNSKNAAHWETWESPLFEVARP